MQQPNDFEHQLYDIGRKYKEEKKQGEGNDLTSGKKYQKSTTAETIAKETKVSEKTVRKAEKYALVIDAIAVNRWLMGEKSGY